MIRQSIPARRYCGVADSAGVVAKVFSSPDKCDRFIRDVREVKRLLKQGANPTFAFPPHIDVKALVEIAKQSNGLKAVELREDLAPGSTIKTTDIHSSQWTSRPSWSLQTLVQSLYDDARTV
jgi:hypothetical protein